MICSVADLLLLRLLIVAISGSFLFKRHCIASVYLEDTDWMLVLDADSGVVNPNHCIEEWIDDRVNIIFYERYNNWEISAASFLVRNSDFGIKFLRGWANREFTLHDKWHGYDNGVLHLHALDALLPHAVQVKINCYSLWKSAVNYDTYMPVVSCVKQALGDTRIWPGKLRIYRRAHGWIRDEYTSHAKWYDGDFMFHLWKSNKITDQPAVFTHLPNVSQCGVGMKGWFLDQTKHVDVSTLRRSLAIAEKLFAEHYPEQGKQVFWLTKPDIGDCFPNCDKDLL